MCLLLAAQSGRSRASLGARRLWRGARCRYLAHPEYSSNVNASAFKSALPNLFCKSGPTWEVFYVQHGGLDRGGCWWPEGASAWGCLEPGTCGSVSPHHLKVSDSSAFGRSEEAIPKPLLGESLVRFSDQKTRRLSNGTVQSLSTHFLGGYFRGLCTGTHTGTCT